MKKLVRFSILLFSPFLFACKKDEGPNSGKLLRKIITLGGDSTLYTFFTYDISGRLIAFTDSTGDYGVTYYQLSYYSTGKLAKCLRTWSYTPSQRVDSFYYTLNGHLAKMTTHSGINYERYFFYDTHGRLIGDSIRDPLVSDYTFHKFDYDTNNDLVRWQRWHTESGTLYQNIDNIATYNNSPNPYISLGLNYFLITDNEDYILSAHERSSISTWTSGPIKYRYEYYPDGLIKGIFVEYPYLPPPTAAHFQFYYE